MAAVFDDFVVEIEGIGDQILYTAFDSGLSCAELAICPELRTCRRGFTASVL